METALNDFTYKSGMFRGLFCPRSVRVVMGAVLNDFTFQVRDVEISSVRNCFWSVWIGVDPCFG